MSAKGKGKEGEVDVDLEAASKKSGGLSNASAACLLFFLGFFAPWCWLIGGWCLSARSGHLKETDGQFVDTVDRRKFWWPKRTRTGAPGPSRRRSTWSLFSAWNTRNANTTIPQAGPSHSNGEPNRRVPTAILDTSVDSGASVIPVYSLYLSSSPKDDSRSAPAAAEKNAGETLPLDRWVRRCRIAAVVSGIILCVAVIIALIAIAGVKAK